MQNLTELLEHYAQSDVVEQFIVPADDPKRMLLSGRKGADLAFHLTAAFEQGLSYVSIIPFDKEATSHLINRTSPDLIWLPLFSV